MATDTMPQLASASRIGWNPITANLYGAPAFLSGDTPIESAYAFMRSYALAQGQGQRAPQSLDECIAAGGGPACLDNDLRRPSTNREWERAIRGLPGQTRQAPGTPTWNPDSGSVTAPIPQGADTSGQARKGCNLWDMLTFNCSPSIGAGGAEGSGPIVGDRPMKSGGAEGEQLAADECGYLDLACHAEKLLGSETVKDIGKRTALLAFALALLVVAIISLR